MGGAVGWGVVAGAVTKGNHLATPPLTRTLTLRLHNCTIPLPSAVALADSIRPHPSPCAPTTNTKTTATTTGFEVIWQRTFPPSHRNLLLRSFFHLFHGQNRIHLLEIDVFDETLETFVVETSFDDAVSEIDGGWTDILNFGLTKVKTGVLLNDDVPSVTEECKDYFVQHDKFA